MSQRRSAIEDTITALSEMERELDETKAYIEEAKRRLLALAREEAERAKGEAIEETSRLAQQGLDRAREEAEREAEKILASGDKRASQLEERIDKVFDRAVELVVEAVLGE